MNWTDVKNAAPGALKLVGAALAATGVGAPVGALVGGLGAIVGQLIGAPPTPDNVAASLQDPALQEKWLEFQANHETELQKMVIDRDAAIRADDLKQVQLELGDFASARERDKAIVAAGRENVRADVMVGADVIGLIACITATVVMHLNGTLDGTVSTLLATFGSYFGLSLRDAHQFEFGSSRGSRNKDAIAASTIVGVKA